MRYIALALVALVLIGLMLVIIGASLVDDLHQILDILQ